MSTISHRLSRPRTLALMWVAAMLAPFAWLSALGLMFSLIDDNCATGSRVLLWASALTCVVLAIAPAVTLLGPWRRSLNPESEAGVRTRLILDLAVAGSLMMALVMLATAVPILFLNGCRP